MGTGWKDTDIGLGLNGGKRCPCSPVLPLQPWQRGSADIAPASGSSRARTCLIYAASPAPSPSLLKHILNLPTGPPLPGVDSVNALGPLGALKHYSSRTLYSPPSLS